jgi:ATP-binding cassette, subfamily B, bacterial HlyB/CyaB
MGTNEHQPVDAGLTGLVAIARMHGIATDAAQLRHAAAAGEEPFDADTLVLSARSIGLKARVVPLRIERLHRASLPALALDRNGKHFVAGRCDGKTALILEAGVNAPNVMPLEAIPARATGCMIVFASRASLAGELARFDFSWFIPAVIKYRRLLLEVLAIFFCADLWSCLSTDVPGRNGQGAGQPNL